MNRLFLLLFVVFAVSMSFADSLPDKTIVIKSCNGSDEYAVSDILSIKFGSDNMVLGMKDGTVAGWPIDSIDVISFFYYESISGTGLVEPLFQSFSLLNGTLVVEAQFPVFVSLSTIDGKLLYSGNCNGELQLPLIEYGAGLYLLVIDGRTYKITMR